MQTCYQFSGASETKYATLDGHYHDKTTNKIGQIAKEKASKDANKQQQINQYLKSLDEINTRLGQCNDSDFDCISEADEAYNFYRINETKTKRYKIFLFATR